MQDGKIRIADVKFKAVIVGAVADNAGTLFVMTLLAAALASAGLSEDEVMSRMRSTSGLLLGLIIGLGCTVLGGYIAGRIARQDERTHGSRRSSGVEATRRGSTSRGLPACSRRGCSAVIWRGSGARHAE